MSSFSVEIVQKRRKNNISCFSSVIKSEDNTKLPWIELTYLRDTTDRRRHLCHNDWCPQIIKFSSERTELCQMLFLILRYMLYCTVKMVIVEMSLTNEKYGELSSVFPRNVMLTKSNHMSLLMVIYAVTFSVMVNCYVHVMWNLLFYFILIFICENFIFVMLLLYIKIIYANWCCKSNLLKQQKPDMFELVFIITSPSITLT